MGNRGFEIGDEDFLDQSALGGSVCQRSQAGVVEQFGQPPSKWLEAFSGDLAGSSSIRIDDR